jgi:hypothetical protein
MSLSQNISFVLGASLGGALAVAPGPWLMYALDAAGFAVSFFFLSRLQPLPRLAASDAAPPPVWREIAAGLRYAVSRRDLLGSYSADLVAMFFAYPNALGWWRCAPCCRRWCVTGPTSYQVPSSPKTWTDVSAMLAWKVLSKPPMHGPAGYKVARETLTGPRHWCGPHLRSRSVASCEPLIGASTTVYLTVPVWRSLVHWDGP